MSQAPDQPPDIPQLVRLGVKLTVRRRGGAPLDQPPYTACQHDQGGQQYPGAEQHPNHLLKPLVGQCRPPENPL